MLETIFRDLRYSFRMMAKNKGITAVAVISIALGIGANTTVFSVINAVLLRSLPYKDPNGLVLVWGDTKNETKLKKHNQVSWTDVLDYRAQSQSFEDVTTYTGWNPIMSGDSEAERIPAIQVGDGYFKIMKGTPILGRVFTPEEQEDGKDFVIVLGHALWQRRYAGDPNIVGKAVQLNGRPYTIVGVMGPDFHPLPSTLVEPQGQFYRPIAETYNESARDERHLRAIARLKPGVTIGQARNDLSIIARRIEEAHPLTNHDWGVEVVSMSDEIVGGIRGTLWMVFGAVVFVLLVACANVANLLLARSSVRSKEITIRSAIGAVRSQLIRQLLTESLVLSIVGGLVGLLLAVWGTSLVSSAGEKINPMFQDIHLDLRVLAFTSGLALLTGLIFGLAPALQISRPNLAESLKESGRGSGPSAAKNRLRSVLVVSEIALTLVLLVCAGLLIRTVMRLRAVDTGFNTHNILTMNIGLPGVKYPKPEDKIAFYQQVTERISHLPGVKAAGTTSVLPLSSNFDGRGIGIEDIPKPPGEEISVDMYVTTPGYLKAMEISTLKGRPISEQDTKDSFKVVLVNKTMAEQLWTGQDVLGKHIAMPADTDGKTTQWRTIVGVMSDVSQYGIDQKPPMQMYLPHSQFPTSFNTIVVKTQVDPNSLVNAVRGEIRAVDKDQAVYGVTTLEELFSDSILIRRFVMGLLFVFAALALVLAAVGIYGVMSYVAAQRTHEIGIRMALGAQNRDVLKLILGNGMFLALLGVAAGLVGAFALTRLMAGLLFGVTSTDTVTFVSVSAGLIAVALIACYVPARRATKVDPLTALRYE
ncbi:MAG TPA: ABC transporter permease [Pyrinomonadaceae bacterium]|nr:ABC transporter permease [Pyrinomonadaceae bacterium]